MDVDALGPVEWTGGPVHTVVHKIIIHAWKNNNLIREKLSESENVTEREWEQTTHNSFIADMAKN
jgi:hypothetical protein